MTEKSTLIVYGSRCIWWDSIYAAGKYPNGLPCCPHCKSPLFEMEEKEWYDGAKKYDSEKDPGYFDFIVWQRGKCFKTVKEAKEQYEMEKK